ncbi:ABC transporter substrate-binding protein [Oceanispirochaeta sp.]|jgi:putative ABC transport system substrate-binding protein|uniref:ABC transporter substrate-binding protein n=1 Tax=Oceanispirochaeta sp. TaxID=2035350 RepID=UPI002615752C|nr:ABC transporter substrate-binding protein [Oceanispirochaeta sp.]MDA3957955.1 ABC transporter substrate-binding protein [Oceanispirochaeta sp.]
MKKLTTLFLSLFCLSAFVFASGQQETAAPAEKGAETVKPIKIGITKIVSHPALDALEQGAMEVILESYPDAQFDLQNANGDMNTASSIAQKFKSDKVDLAIGIATPTAQALANTLKTTPVLYSAVTDPVDAGLVESYDQGGAYITGISDMTPVKDQIALLASLTEIKTLGHIYSSSEANAVRLAEMAREACAELGIEFIETTVSNSAEVKQATQAIIGKVDGIYISTDNTVVSALSAVSDVASRAGIPIMSADPSSAEENQILIAWGFDYYKMGKAAGRMAVEVLGGKKTSDIPTAYMTSVDDIDLLVNLDLAAQLGITIPADLQKKAATLIKNGEIIKQ